MSIRLYLDSELTTPVSNGDMANPDTADICAGESSDRRLYLANEQSALAGDVDGTQTALTLERAAFQDGDLIIVDAETMKVVSGGGASSINVQRGISGAVPAAHPAGSKVYSAYNYESITITPRDTSGSDESGWVRLALTQDGLDSAIPGQPLTIGSKRYDEVLTLRRRYTIPSGTGAQEKMDIKLEITGTERPV